MRSSSDSAGLQYGAGLLFWHARLVVVVFVAATVNASAVRASSAAAAVSTSVARGVMLLAGCILCSKSSQRQRTLADYLAAGCILCSKSSQSQQTPVDYQQQQPSDTLHYRTFNKVFHALQLLKN